MPLPSSQWDFPVTPFWRNMAHLVNWVLGIFSVREMKMDDVEAWKERIRCAADEELLALCQAGYLGLGHDKSEHWIVLIIEEEMQRRCLNYC